jgi:hypothetical protein
MRIPPQILYTGLKRSIGSPMDYETNMKSGTFNSSDGRIPIPETDQRKSIQIPGASSQGSLSEDFNALGLRSPIGMKEEVKKSAPTERIMPRFSGANTFAN